MKVTDFLAIYAAGLSTIVFVWNYVRATPRIKVEVISGSDEIDGEFVFGAYISVKNPSSQTVHLSNISILYPYKQSNLTDILKHIIKYQRIPKSEGWVSSSLSNYKIDDGCPISLEPGKAHSILVPERILEQIFEDSYSRKIKAVVQDQLWRNKYSNKFSLPKDNV